MSKIVLFAAVLFAIGFINTAKSEVINNIDLEQVETELTTDGVVGYIHGAVPAYGHFVFTYRDKENFFNHIEFSLIPRSSEAMEVLKTLRRHDKIKIIGQFSSRNPSEFRHIHATSIEVIKKYESDISTPPYRHELKFPEELNGKESFIGKIHAITYEGKILVVEYKDTVLPLFMEDTSSVSHLFRNDTVEVFFKVIPPRGRRPMHLEVDMTRQEPIKVLAPIVEGHGDMRTMTGELVMFPQSPQIMFNIFAIRVVDEFLVVRNFTLVNFEDMDLFTKLREKLQNIWDVNISTAQGGRNMWVNPKVVLKVSGLKNVVSPVQANPQLLIQSLDDIEVTVKLLIFNI